MFSVDGPVDALFCFSFITNPSNDVFGHHSHEHKLLPCFSGELLERENGLEQTRLGNHGASRQPVPPSHPTYLPSAFFHERL